MFASFNRNLHRGFATAAAGNPVGNRCSTLSSGLDGAIAHRILLRAVMEGGGKSGKWFE